MCSGMERQDAKGTSEGAHITALCLEATSRLQVQKGGHQSTGSSPSWEPEMVLGDVVAAGSCREAAWRNLADFPSERRHTRKRNADDSIYVTLCKRKSHLRWQKAGQRVLASRAGGH